MRQTPFYIVGNWKSNKTIVEAVIWMQDFITIWKKNRINTKKVKIILCASYIHLNTLKSLIELAKLPIELGAQDVSAYPSGTFTGAISAQMLQGLVKYSIIGHSERRQKFNETEELLINKITQARQRGLEPIYCIQDEKMPVPESVNIVGYEPVWAISKGNPYTTKAERSGAVNQKIELIKKQAGRELIALYGGSTNPDNIVDFTKEPYIDGILPGGASLVPQTFFKLITNACL
jgi:triosephosphate isomerase (TIM)